MPALSTSEASVVASTVLQYWLLAIGLVLVTWLVVSVATIPGSPVLRLNRLPDTWLLCKLLVFILLRFKLTLAVIIS